MNLSRHLHISPFGTRTAKRDHKVKVRTASFESIGKYLEKYDLLRESKVFI